MLLSPVIFGLAALIAATLFTGAALYITLVEHPVRATLDDAAALRQWKPSYARALPIQAALAVIGGVLGAIAVAVSHDWVWAAGAGVLLLNWPFTMLVIMPTNKRLKQLDPEADGAAGRTLLTTWSRLHNVRSGLGVIAVLLFAAALAA